MRRPCMDCGTPADGTRCDRCTTVFARKRQEGRPRTPRAYDRGTYRGDAAIIRATATRCHICGQGQKAGDPWQADHLIPLKEGGGGDGPLAAAHRSCNIRRANQLRAGKEDPSSLARQLREGGRARRTRPPHDTTPPPGPDAA